MTIAELLNLVPEENRNEAQEAISDHLKSESFNYVANNLQRENAWDWAMTSSAMKSVIDREKSRAINSYKENHFEDDYKERFAKENPPKTEAEKRLAELEDKFRKQELEKTKLDRINRAKNQALKNNIPNDALDFIDIIASSSNDDEYMVEKINSFSELINKISQSATESVLKNNGFKPDGTPPKGDNPFTLDQIKQMSQDEVNKNWDNPDFQRALSQQ